ncbi:MAG TPA: outer membrane beta-barrel protein [Steroidobacteraceae bacterium]|nr:outer membrane beta-barrel protein [Steroidobacteraceae bacterium]
MTAKFPQLTDVPSSQSISLKEAYSMSRSRFLVIGAICCALAVGTKAAHAEDAKPADAKPTAPSLSDVLAASGIAITGWIDTSYEYLNGEGVFATDGLPPNRVFDDHKNAFSLHQAAINIAYQPKEGFGAVVNVIAGQDVQVFAPYDINQGNAKIDVPNAYIQYASGPITVIGGRFVTLAGAETIDPRTMTNFSRSILFGYAIPFAHTGLRMTYAPSDTLSLILGVNNGWDVLKETNSQKTVEVGAAWVPSKAFSLNLSGYFGDERVIGNTGDYGPNGLRSVVDVVATWNATDALSLVLNYDWGQQKANGYSETASWQGIAGYVNYQFNEQWRTSLRAEYFDDKDGYRTGIVQKWKEATLTFGYAPVKAVELRVEGRYDKSDKQAFVKSFATCGEDSYCSSDISDNQASFGVEAVFKF